MSRAGAAARRSIARLLPAHRRDWVQAVWAEAPEVSPGLRRLLWRAGGVRVIAWELLIRRRLLTALLFAMAAGSVIWEVWPGPPTSSATGINRVYALTTVLLLAGLGLASRLFLRPSDDSRTARSLRIGVYIGLLALVPARAAVLAFALQRPRGGVPLLLYRAIAPKGIGTWLTAILSLVLLGLYAIAMFWITSRRSRVAPTTLVIGTVSGLALGLVMYVVAPLGLSKAATNPWLPGSDIDPLVFLAWVLVLLGPGVAAGVAHQRYTASKGPPPPRGDQVRQVAAAGLLSNLLGALIVNVLGTGTIATMINASWLRSWLYHGRHLLFGVAGLQPVLRGDPGAIAYSHEITAVSDAGVLAAVLIGFLVIAALEAGYLAMCMLIGEPTDHGDPRRNGGNPPDPQQPPDPPGGAQLAEVAEPEPGVAVRVLSLYDNGGGIDQERCLVGSADAAVEPVGTR
jgi:hypothetical protein